MNRIPLILLAIFLLILTGCSQVLDGDGMIRSYTQITQDTAREMMAREDGKEITDMEDMDSFAEAIRPVSTLVIEANGHVFYASFEDNSSAKALQEKLSSDEIELELHDYGGFEKVGALPWELPRNDVSITTVPGDVILYLGSQITIYYDKNTWSLTRLAKISGAAKEDLLQVLGEGNVTVKLWVEWSE